ncbi:hypothetical protein SAMN03159496_01068 [Rhizobium sp. NFR07]|nr:hypothetical protein SAMN03159496_01068 [Rhizobium sp. NFR07]
MMAEQVSRPEEEKSTHPRLSRLLPASMLYWLVTAAFLAVLNLPKAKDYIGPDNDDVMRLVEVRDWLAGQGWFDLMQYRLGLDGGTLMHWSRFIDAPIGLLIKFFSLFMTMEAAENVAATLWPLITAGPLFLALGLAGLRFGGPRVIHISLGLGALFIFACGKFSPGAIDHHNVQLALAMVIAALLADRKGRARDHAGAGIAVALAVAIGAETVPFVAVACFCVAMRWLWQGKAFARGARAFGLSLALAITAAFFATVPPHAYAAVTCDNLSFGFYSLAAVGGAGLFGLTYVPAGVGIAGRVAASAVLGAILAAVAIVVAPQCLGSPLANLDPMLIELWLRQVSEARSIVGQFRTQAYTLGGFYAVGLLAIIVCILRICQGRQRDLHLLFLVLVGASWAISLVQLRGSFFVNVMSIPPLALLIADLQQRVRDNSRDIPATIGFALVTLGSVPAVWAVSGAVWDLGLNSVDITTVSSINAGEDGECDIAQSAEALRALPPGVVVSPSNSGAEILRFTRHRVLAAPYHRNQGGMLTELHIGMAKPREALAFIKGAGVTIIAFCKGDPSTSNLIELKNDGLYAALAKGEIPAYLTLVGEERAGLRLYRVNPDAPN